MDRYLTKLINFGSNSLISQADQPYTPNGIEYEGKIVRLLEFRNGLEEKIAFIQIHGFIADITSSFGLNQQLEKYIPIRNISAQNDIRQTLKDRYPDLKPSTIYFL